MNIAYLSSSSLISDSANAVHVMKMCESMASLGYAVTLHGFKGTGDTDQDVLRYYSIQDDVNFKLKRHNETDLKINTVLKNLKKAFFFLPIGGLSSLLYGYFKLKLHLSKDIDLIFARNSYWLYPFKNKHPFIYETHSPPVTKFHQFFEKRLFLSPYCKKIVVISEALKSIYLDIFPDIENKIIVAHDAAQDNKEADTAIQNLLDRPVKNIGYVGHVYKGRGINVIIETAKSLPDLKFHIVGGRTDLIKEFQTISPRNVVFHGHQPYEKLSDFYKSFDIVLAPYQEQVAVFGNRGDTAKFMSPLKLFEYMSWGLPMICSDLPVLREVLVDNENSLLVKHNDANEWVKAIKQLSENTKLRHYITKTARNTFLKQYTWDARAQFILSQATS